RLAPASRPFRCSSGTPPGGSTATSPHSTATAPRRASDRRPAPADGSRRLAVGGPVVPDPWGDAAVHGSAASRLSTGRGDRREGRPPAVLPREHPPAMDRDPFGS